MSIEKNIERIADALEMLVTSMAMSADVVSIENGNEVVQPTPEPAPKKRRTRKKKEAAPAPQPEPVPDDEPAPAEAEPEAAKPVEQEEAGETITPEQLNEGLMAIAQKGSPDMVNKILGILAQCNANSAAEVPPHRRQWVLEEARKAVAGAIH